MEKFLRRDVGWKKVRFDQGIYATIQVQWQKFYLNDILEAKQ